MTSNSNVNFGNRYFGPAFKSSCNKLPRSASSKSYEGLLRNSRSKLNRLKSKNDFKLRTASSTRQTQALFSLDVSSVRPSK